MSEAIDDERWDDGMRRGRVRLNERITDYLREQKKTWPNGPWQTEPDREDFEHAGFACLLLRHFSLGFWCGYVGVDCAHPYYGRDWKELCLPFNVNYSAACDGTHICHMPRPGMPDDVWWLGFDCGHLFELAPGLMRLEEKIYAQRPPDCRKDRYVTLPEVKRRTETLAETLRATAAGAAK